MKQISWKCTDEERRLIKKIAKRAMSIGNPARLGVDQQHVEMDVTATHANGCPLNLRKMLDFPEYDFFHDLYGIYYNLNRKTGKLENCFLPRCAL